VAELLLLLNAQVQAGRSTPGNQLTNDRDVTFLPEGVSLPTAN
jgi:arylsulfatase A